MDKNSIIRKTGQRWKLLALYEGVLAGGLLMFVGLAKSEYGVIAMWLFATGVLLGAISFIFACVSIRCPKCKAAWLWYSVTKQESGKWLAWLGHQSKCYRCGYGKELQNR